MAEPIEIERIQPPVVEEESRSIGPLLRRIADDGRALLQQEIELAKLEVLRSATALLRGSAFIAVGALFLALGLLVLLVFAVLALGRLLGGEYWLSSLIIGAVLALLGTILLLVGRKGLQKDDLKPDKTIDSVRQTKSWAQDEARELKREIKG